MTTPQDGPRRSLLTGSASDLDHHLWEVAVGAAGVGVFVWDLVGGELRWDDSLLEIFGLDERTFDGAIDTFFASVHPDDRDRVSAALDIAVEKTGTYEAEYRIVDGHGETRWITARGTVVAGPGGEPEHLLGAAFDSTAERDEDARVTQVLEAMPMAFFSLDRDWHFTYANPVAQRLLGAVSVDVVGSVIWELFPESVGSDFERAYRQAMDTGRPVMFEAYYPPPLDDWYEVRAWPTPNGLSVYFLDITERRRLQEELLRTSRVSSLLAQITGALNETMEAEEAVAVLAELVAPTLADWCIVTLVEGEGALTSNRWRERLRDLATWHGDPEKRALVERYAKVRISALSDESFVRRGLESQGVPVVLASQAEEAVGAALESAEAREVLAELAPESAVAVPLRGRGRTVGLLTAYRSADRPTFGPEDLDVLREVAARAGLALDNARVFAEQRKLSEALQRSLLTDPPEPDHLHVTVRYEPAAEGAEVGGDWYDSFIQADGATNVVIGDVVGHDTAAATAMGQLRGLLRGIAITTGEGPAEVLHRVDAAMRLLQIETTATAVAARFEQAPEDREQGVIRLRWSSAGHPPPLVAVANDPARPGHGLDVAGIKPDDDVDVDVHELEQDPGVLLGLDPDLPRHDAVFTLPQGSTVLLYTDGLVERRGEDIDAGIARLRDAFADVVAQGLAADLACDAILRRLRPDVPEDDVALVMVRLHREDRPRPPEAGPQHTPPGLH